MPIVVVSGPAAVYQGDPSERNSVTDPEILQHFHGLHSEEPCSLYCDPNLAEALDLDGGLMRFHFDPSEGSFQVQVAYQVSHRPTPEQMNSLLEETSGQFSDGMGSGMFTFLDEAGFSASLFMAIRNQNPDFQEDAPEYLLDAYPMGLAGADSATIEYFEEGRHMDEHLRDLTKAAEAGHADAHCALGQFYIDPGLGYLDFDIATSHFNTAIEMGNELGAVCLAHELLHNEELGIDIDRAERILREATEKGGNMPKALLGSLLVEGDKLQQNLEEGVRLLEEAADEGNPVAMAEMGDNYEFGIGVELDLQKAKALYESAIEDGFDGCEIALTRVNDQMNMSKGLFATVEEMLNSQFGSPLPDDVNEGVVMIAEDDPEMAQAIRRAQAAFPKFLKSLEVADSNVKHAVKIKLEIDDVVEHIWLKDIQYNKGKIFGVINNEPSLTDAIQMGEPRKAHMNEVSDWLIFSEDGSSEGGYSIDLLTRRQQEES